METRDPSRRASEAAEKAKSTASELAGAAKDVAGTRVQGMFETNKQAAVSQIGAVAEALRRVSSELEGRYDPLARTAGRAADMCERFSHSLEERDLSAAFETAQDYARRQPAIFFGGAFLLGLAASRFLKASAEHHREHRARGQYDPSYPIPTYRTGRAESGVGELSSPSGL